MDSETSVDERTDPMVARRRQPSPTPVSHVGASARTLSPSARLGASTELQVEPSRRPLVLPIALGVVGVFIVSTIVLAAFVLPDTLGAWATAPKEGAGSALEPVEIDNPPEDPASRP